MSARLTILKPYIMLKKKWLELGDAKVGEDLPVPVQYRGFSLMRNPFHFLGSRLVLTYVLFPKSNPVVREKRNNFGAPRAPGLYVKQRQLLSHSCMDPQGSLRFAEGGENEKTPALDSSMPRGIFTSATPPEFCRAAAAVGTTVVEAIQLKGCGIGRALHRIFDAADRSIKPLSGMEPTRGSWI